MRYKLVCLLFIHCAFLASLSAGSQSARILASAQALPEERGEIMRETVDPCLGMRWRWIADPLHPEWPYRLVLAGSVPVSTGVGVVSKAGATGITPRAVLSLTPGTVAARIIRAGDLITVRQQTGTVSAQLQALALDSASSGHPLRARLTINSDRSQGMNSLLSSSGPVIIVIAQMPGEAIWSNAHPAVRLEEANQ